MANETRYQETSRPYVPLGDTLVIVRLVGNRIHPINKLSDNLVLAGDKYMTGKQNKVYTKNNWELMIRREYGGNEVAWFAANGNPIDERDGK
jgi:hypothetical protein